MLSVPVGSIQDGVAVGSDVGVKRAGEVRVAEGIKVSIVVGIGERFGKVAGETFKGMFGIVASGEGTAGVV